MKSLNSAYRKRLVVLALGMFALFSILIFQFYKIQIVEGDKWTKLAQRQHFFDVTEPFMRGKFISNNSIKKGHPEEPQNLVLDIQKYHLYIDPISIPDKTKDEISRELFSRLDLPPESEAKFRGQFNRESRSRRMAMWLDGANKDLILAWWLPFASKHKIPRNAVYFVSDYQRSYPFGKLLGQVLHTVQNNKDEITKQASPTGGLELQFNSYLVGKLGKRHLKRSPRHSFETGTVIKPPENGADVYLTINHVLQAIAEEEIEKGVLRANAKGGWAVMMEPKTGEILAIAQYPFFYPSNYTKYFNDPEKIDYTRLKVLTDAYEPGSVMKPITLSIALKANKVLTARGEKPLFDPKEKMATSDSSFPGRRKPLTDMSLHRFLNMNMALQKSSNIYPARLVQKIIDRLGVDWYRNELHESFGFGKRTNIELPSESRGLLPTPGKLHPSGQLEWSKPTPFSLAMGYNLLVNSLQMVKAFATIANGGYAIQPTLVRKIVKTHPDGKQEILLDNTQPKNNERVLDADIVAEVINAMKFVTKNGGSGRRAEIWGYTEVGKTGTARKIENGAYTDQKHVSSFVGFTPTKDAAFVLLVSINEPECRFIRGVGYNQSASICAAPVFREIARRSLEYLGITPDDPHGYPKGDPRYDPSKADWVAETIQLQEMYEKWNK
jgi:cell division protein FtsI (penicillin-binding protein 3)